jgi:nitrous oxidase accessory protein NosD
MSFRDYAHHLGWLSLGAMLFVSSSAAQAANLCVNPAGSGGCYAAIGTAVAAPGADNVIRVAKGVYHENVVITKSLALLGEGSENTTIDATGLLNGINIDGYGHPGVAHVIVSGFTVQNANAQGILVTNATDVTISNNHLTGNDQSLTFGPSGPECPAPGFPVYFLAGEGFDCGEAIHLSGVDHSVVADNLVDQNAGGILLSDDTGQTHDNLISGNVVRNNPYDCGITLASHNIGAFYTPPPPGVFSNRIIGNRSAANGLISGEGAGVGIFTAAPGAKNYGNTVSSNILTGNALPGVAMHSHAPGQVLDDNIITRNWISGNGTDGDLGPSLPAMGISISSAVVPVKGTVISQNVFKGEGMDIAVNVSNGASAISAHFNSFFGAIGVGNLGAGSISATANWWKCSKGPGANGCSATSGSNITTDPWLTSPF